MPILTHRGSTFDYLKPTVESIDIKDIIISLIRINRFLGHTSRAYNVAEHSFFCLAMAQKMGYSKREQLLVFIHDFTEAYMGDCPSPLKELLPEFSVLEAEIEQVICQAFDIEPPTEEEYIKIKKIDMTMLVIEMKRLTKHEWESLLVHDVFIECIEDEDFNLSEVPTEKLMFDLLIELFEYLMSEKK